jgi:hypothetical protein
MGTPCRLNGGQCCREAELCGCGFEVRGEVVETVRGPEARAHIDQLTRKYTGGDYAGAVRSERVILKVAPTRRQFIRDV